MLGAAVCVASLALALDEALELELELELELALTPSLGGGPGGGGGGPAAAVAPSAFDAVELLSLVPSCVAACRLARNVDRSFSSCARSELADEVEEAEAVASVDADDVELDVELLEDKSLTRFCRSVSSWLSNPLRLVEALAEVDVESLEDDDALALAAVGGGPGGGPFGPPESLELELELEDAPLLSCVRNASSAGDRLTEPEASREEDETLDDDDDVELDCAKLSPWFDTLLSSCRNSDMACWPIDERDMLTLFLH